MTTMHRVCLAQVSHWHKYSFSPSTETQMGGHMHRYAPGIQHQVRHCHYKQLVPIFLSVSNQECGQNNHFRYSVTGPGRWLSR